VTKKKASSVMGMADYVLDISCFPLLEVRSMRIGAVFALELLLQLVFVASLVSIRQAFIAMYSYNARVV
jgi:hypothetical protein